MIRKPLDTRSKLSSKYQHAPVSYYFSNALAYCPSNSNKENVKKKLFNTNSSYENQSKRSSKQQALKQISNVIPKNRNINFQQQNYLKEKINALESPLLFSQTSVNDLSQIVPLDFSYSTKKQSIHQSTQLKNKSSIDNTNQKSKLKLSFLKQIKQKTPQITQTSDQTSFRIDDLQILDVYETQREICQSETKNSSIVNKSEDLSFIKSKRASGTIKRNSQCSRSSSSSMNISQDQDSLCKRKQKIYNIQEVLSQDVRKCGETLFMFISSKKNKVEKIDLQKSSLSCQFKLILGPILTKLKQSKYLELTLSEFNTEFQNILKDFEIKQKLDIIDKINHKKFQKITPNEQVQHEQQYLKIKTIHIQNRNHYKDHKNQQRQQQCEDSMTPNKRLRNLHQKVDLYLNKIYESNCQAYHTNQSYLKKQVLPNYLPYTQQVFLPTQNQVKKQKLSILMNQLMMSQLSQIEEIQDGNDSDEMPQNQISQTQGYNNTSHLNINQQVNQLSGDEGMILHNHKQNSNVKYNSRFQQYGRNRSSGLEKYQQLDYIDSNSCLYELDSNNQIQTYRPLFSDTSQCMFQLKQQLKEYGSLKKSLDIQSSLFQQQQSGSSFSPIVNLQFNQLSKYL